MNIFLVYTNKIDYFIYTKSKEKVFRKKKHRKNQTTKLKLIQEQKHKGKAAYSLVSVTLAVRNWYQALLQFTAYHL